MKLKALLGAGGGMSEIISCFRLCLLKWWPCCRVPGRPPASQRSRHLAQALGEGRASEGAAVLGGAQGGPWPGRERSL